MTTQQTQTKPQATEPVSKKKYLPPQVTRHGSLVKFTRGPTVST